MAAVAQGLQLLGELRQLRAGHPEAALLLDESPAPATRQLGEALRQQTPPLGGEEARPTPGEVHVLV